MPLPPAGTMTFLFTDIEGSTRLWQEHAAAMPAALARHDALTRETITDRAGHVFKHTGDGACAAFADASAAVEAAIALQRELKDAGPPLRVRMALDSGPAYARDADYFGPTLNRTSRVLAVGAGGQILATAATMALVSDVESIDLGLHRLRDLGEPVRLHQLVAPGLERNFPPLRSLDRFRHSLPVLRTSFVGREAELQRLRAHLAASRLLTITGVGGCGKTRLALALASQEIERFPDGVYFVDLSASSEPALVWGAVAVALGARTEASAGSVSPRDAVLGQLTDAAALVVLDNCEHLIDAAAEVAAAIVGRPGPVVTVATSREPLGVEGEQVFRVPSLALPVDASDATESEAVRLFVERASAADAAFVLTPAIAPAVAEICRRLDGIPLAIELAAVRVRHLPPAEIVRRLDDRFRLLTGGPRGGTQRQQTLAATLAWSFDLLAERERTLLRRAAVFVDGFSLAAAEGVCAGDGLEPHEVVDVLGALVDKSLVSLHAAEHRYRLLETIRLYALDRLIQAGEAETLRTRHLEWFDATFGSWRRHQRGAAGLEVGNLRAARAWAHEIGDRERVARSCVVLFWHAGNFDPAWHEERGWCETALRYERLPADTRADVLAVASFYDIAAGDWPGSIDRARRAIALAPEPGEGMVAGAYIPLAIGLMVTDPDAADRAIDEGVARIGRARTPAFPPASLASLRLGTALMRGDAARAVELGRTHGGMVFGNRPTLGLAYALHLVGDQGGAEAAILDSAIEGVGGEHARHLLLALTAASTARWNDAARELAAAAALVRRYRYPLTLNDCLVVCGALAALEGRFERASVLLAAVADRDSVRSPELWAVYLHYRRLVRAALDPATVRRSREEARTLDLDRALDAELARVRRGDR